LRKALINPNAAPVQALSRDERELMIAANNDYLGPPSRSPRYLVGG
jgi:hypothetical protein